MTTTFDIDSSTATIAAAAEADTQTIAAAWSSSPLGLPDNEVGCGFTEASVADDLPPVTRHARIAAALAGGIGLGAALGLMLFDFDHASTVVVPGVGVSQHRPAPVHEIRAPEPVVSLVEPAPSTVIRAPRLPAPAAPTPAPTPAPAPQAKPDLGSDVATPAPVQNDTTVVIDIPIPPIPDFPPLPPQDPDPVPPEDPDPEPPVLDKPDFKLPQPSDPEPESPVLKPDLSLAPKDGLTISPPSVEKISPKK